MRRVLFYLLILNALLLPLLCLPALFLLNASNPFITGFTVENRTAATVYVTPVGTGELDSRRHPLPLVVWKAPSMPSSQQGQFVVRSGETITLYYDWDDINLSELVVESEDGTLRQLAINARPPANPELVIDDLDRLGSVNSRVYDAYVAAQHPVRWWLVLAATACARSHIPVVAAVVQAGQSRTATDAHRTPRCTRPAAAVA